MSAPPPSEDWKAEAQQRGAEPRDSLAPGRKSRTGAALAGLGSALAADLSVLGRRFVVWVRALLETAGPALRKLAASHPGSRKYIRARHVAAGSPPAPDVPPAVQNLPPSRSGGLSKRGKWIAAAGAIFVAAIVGVAATLTWALRDLPSDAWLAGSAEPSILLESADGQALARKGPFKVADLDLAGFPKELLDAVLGIEDRRFYSHSGIDPFGILRALSRNIGAGEVVEGGSTINQQLVKILHLERDRTLKRKIREAVLAIWLDMRLDKDEILARYLNNVYMGAGATGVPAAARTYFGKQAGELDLAESALLAGLIKAPSQLNPLQDLPAAQARAALVLDAMVASGSLAADRAAAAKAAPATLHPRRAEAHAGTWFADWIAEEAAEITGSFRGAMRVRTTLEPRLQAAAEKVVAAALADAEAASVSQAALVALRPDGAVVAMVGGKSYGDSEFNRAVDALRQPGSTFKLFVYYAALRSGLSLDDRVEDGPLEVEGWKPENFGRYYGRVSLAEAFARSLNSAAVRLAMEVGLGEVEAAARDLGIEAPLATTPSLALGSSEVSLLDLTGAYASVRAGVAPIEPWGISGFGTDDQERMFALGPPVQPTRSLDPYHEPLVGLLKLVVDRGTGRAAALDGFAAGKTGTSQNYRDAWFVGFNEDYVVGVWVGNDDGAPMDEVTGGKLPASIWRDFMLAAEAGAASPAPEPEASGDEVASEEVEDEPAVQQCNYRACSRAYRSFRSSDCTFQPYGGRRRICEK